MTERWLIVAPELGINSAGEVIPGGVQRAGRCFCRALASAPALKTLSVFSLTDAPDAAPHLERMLRLYAPPKVTLRIKCFGGSRFQLSAAVWREQFKIDQVLYLHLYQAVLGLAPFHPPYTLIGHGAELFEPLVGLRRLALRRADRFITVSAHTAQTAKSLDPRIPEAQIVPLCLEPPMYQHEDSDPGFVRETVLSERHPAALMVGTMSRWQQFTKGHREVIAAWEQVSTQIPNAELWIVGGGDAESDLRVQAAALPPPVRDRIRFWGRLNDSELEQLWRRACLFVLPSTREGFGLVYLEAMRAGLPCIASNADAAREVVIHEQTGLITPPQPNLIAQAILRLLKDPHWAAQLGAAGRIRCAELFQFAHFRLRVLHALGLES